MEKLNVIKEGKKRDSFFFRFNKYVIKSNNENDCWGWIGCKNYVGYPIISIGRKFQSLRVSRLILNDLEPIKDKSHCALHKCDNPECTNPKHLFWGTKKENTQDMISKSRNSNPPILTRDKTNRCKIKSYHKEMIQELLKTNNMDFVANYFDVNKMTIRRFIKSEKLNYTHIRKNKK